MRRSWLLSAAVLAGALALGCADQPLPPTAADPADPSLGAVRFRPSFGFFIFGGGGSSSLAIQAGWEPGITAEEICADFTGGVQEEGQKGQVVFAPHGFHLQTSGGDATIVVYQYAAGIVTDVCQLVGTPIVGTGTGHFTFQIQAADFGATIIHENVQGTIDLAGGGQARVFGVARVTILPDGTQIMDVEQVRLTPI
jgi:hypothetical protein